jgi:4-diphosphocytidyl-2C-methyl-D-erythritol kinase
MDDIRVKAYGKLNLCLDVVRKMDNGYHELSTVMQSVSLCDDIVIEFNSSNSVTAKSNLCFLPSGDKNIAVKAAKLFFEAAGMPVSGCVININKRIPVCAGTAGGSADGAAVLRALNKAFGAGFSREELEKLSEKLGSDVPFCVAGGTAYCTGRGEIMHDLTPLPECTAVICKPCFPISTAELFNTVDSAPIKHRPDTEGLIKAIEQGCLSGIARRMYNVFEDVLPPRYSEILRIKARLLDGGALGASMTGTGSAVFGLFDDPEAAERIYVSLKKQYAECYVVKMLEKYV